MVRKTAINLKWCEKHFSRFNVLPFNNPDQHTTKTTTTTKFNKNKKRKKFFMNIVYALQNKTIY